MSPYATPRWRRGLRGRDVAERLAQLARRALAQDRHERGAAHIEALRELERMPGRARRMERTR